MKIPKELKVGKRTVVVKEQKVVKINKQECRGAFHLKEAVIRVSRENLNGYKYTPAERSETFWHELTHAILYDMDNRLAYNEKFVIAFSKRLDQAIRSAKF